MAKPHDFNKTKRDELVLAVASGESVISFCRRTRLARATASFWQSDSSFDEDVAFARRQMLDRTLGKLARASEKAADKLIASMDAGTETNQLKAAIAVLDKLHEIAEFTDLEGRIDELEQRIEATRPVGGNGRVYQSSN